MRRDCLESNPMVLIGSFMVGIYSCELKPSVLIGSFLAMILSKGRYLFYFKQALSECRVINYLQTWLARVILGKIFCHNY